ncbi:MAG: YicC family protein [Planctomycetes bacterium]|nr:YicC family protein [Planctomycetota bacterium]
MTGYARTRREYTEASIEVEIRSLNSRFLKITASLSGVPLSREEEILGRVRQSVHRGTIHLTLDYAPAGREAPFRVNRAALAALLSDIAEASRELGRDLVIDAASLLSHEGLLVPAEIPEELVARDWPRVIETLDLALADLVAMRETEGTALRTELRARGEAIGRALSGVRARAPAHLAAFRERLRQRLDSTLAREGVAISAEDLARELVFYADRSDVTEELDRLASHFDQYFRLLDSPAEAEGGAAGRKLEFVVQEILREVNTLGSKTYDPEASRAVIDAKADLERIKEQLQNIE